MIRTLLCCGVILALLNSEFANGQTSAIPNTVRAVNALERLTDSNGLGANEMIYGIPLPPGKVIGDTYLSTSFRQAAILLYKDNKLLEGYPIRYDIQSDELDVKTSKGIKVLEGRNIKSFLWVDSAHLDPVYFVNAKEYKLGGTPLTGFFEVLVDGKAPLFKKTNLALKKANYNEALSVGSRDDKILKQSEFYIGQSGRVIELPSTKKKFLPLFESKAAEMEKFIDTSGLSIKKQDDLIAIFKHYNALIKD